jgi:flagellar biosynthesis chaperone FliJ
MKTVKLLFGAMCILFIQGFSVESSAQNILDSLRNKKIGYPDKIVTNSNSIFSVNDGPLSNKFIEAFEKERKNASYTVQKKDENGEIVSEIQAFKDGKGFIIYAYDRIDCSNIEIIYAKSEKFPQEKITQENYVQVFNNFVETLKADFDSKHAQAADKLAQAEVKLAQAADKLAKMSDKVNSRDLKDSANVKSDKPKYYISKNATFIYDGVKLTAKEAREMGLNVVEIDDLKDSANVKSDKTKYSIAKDTSFIHNGVKLTAKEARKMGADVVEINGPKNNANIQSVKFGKSKSADLFINGVKVTVEEARKMGYDVVEIED